MMIRSDSDLNESQERLADLKRQIQKIRKELAARGLDEKAISIATAPQESMADDIAWEVNLYNALKLGDIAAIPDYTPAERGKALIGLRIIKGWTQRQLAEALGVSEAVVSRDERNEYHGISMEKYGKILKALGFEEHPRFEVVTSEQTQALVIPFPRMIEAAASFIAPPSLNLSLTKKG
ncbi:MAG: helix-turn-helix domain-containing protein [Deltaproteobacteria bacterium]|nr:helix-turn-helix domain-containing protein [Deltaproteobacteria bacterium]